MCGRYAMKGSATELADAFQLVRSLDFPGRFNIAPTSLAPVIRQSPEGERVADLLRWGLIPNWAKDASIGNKLNNARAETVAEKPSFRTAYKRRRCLVPALGFFEWRTEGKTKTPFFIHYTSGHYMAMAGLWESWTDPATGELMRTFCVLTTGPNGVMEPIHDRMPVFIQPRDYAEWLDPSVPGEALQDLLCPAPEDGMDAYQVDRAVGNTRNEGPQLIARL